MFKNNNPASVQRRCGATRGAQYTMGKPPFIRTLASSQHLSPMQPMHTMIPVSGTGGLSPRLCQMVLRPCLPWTRCSVNRNLIRLREQYTIIALFCQCYLSSLYKRDELFGVLYKIAALMLFSFPAAASALVLQLNKN